MDGPVAPLVKFPRIGRGDDSRARRSRARDAAGDARAHGAAV